MSKRNEIRNLEDVFNEWGSWGVGDFHEKPMLTLKEAIAKGKPFDTGWHGWTKELQSMRILQKGDSVHVFCHAYMDDPYGDHELLGDFLEEGEWEKIDDEETLDWLEGEFFMYDIFDSADEEDVLPYGSSFEDIIKRAGELMKSCENRLNESFRQCIRITLTRIYGEGDDAKKIIEERIKNKCEPETEGAEK